MQYPMTAQPQYGFAPTMPMMPSMSDMPPAMMAEGGSVADAQSVQSEGRGRDTMLVHMTPKEVGGLQALAMQYGGSLTINPQTGLPEAGFLESLLPTLIGAALTVGSGGVINPYMSAAIVGGIQTARTGDLGQGLMAGLGAFGGAGMGAGLTAAGAPAVVPGATAVVPEVATAVVPEVATTAASTITNPAQQALTNAGLSEAQVLANTGGTLAVPTPAASTIAPTLSEPGAATFTNTNFPAGTAVNPTPTIGQNFSQAGRGVENLFTKDGFAKFVGEAAKDADKEKGVAAVKATGLGGPSSAITKAGLAALPALVDIPEYKEPEKEVSNYKGPYKPSARQVSYPNEEERRRTSEFIYFNPSNPIPYVKGGSVPMLETGGFVLTKKAVDGLGKGSNQKGQANAQRGLGAIPIRGPGTGTSDSIKTSIDKKRPALVSNGEAYVPKKQVAKKGGAKAFYALMKQAEKTAGKRRRA